METIKQITKGDTTLLHQHYIDLMGIKRDSFEIIKTLPNGHRVLIPFTGPPTVNVVTRTSNLSDATNNYTEEDYLKMMESTQ